MLRGVGQVSDQRGDRKALILGLDAENIRRLQGGEPIVVECGDVNLPPLQISLVYGSTEAEVMDAIRPSLAPQVRRRVILPPDKLS